VPVHEVGGCVEDARERGVGVDVGAGHRMRPASLRGSFRTR
jgi:hypothetical protein